MAPSYFAIKCAVVFKCAILRTVCVALKMDHTQHHCFITHHSPLATASSLTTRHCFITHHPPPTTA